MPPGLTGRADRAVQTGLDDISLASRSILRRIVLGGILVCAVGFVAAGFVYTQTRDNGLQRPAKPTSLAEPNGKTLPNEKKSTFKKDITGLFGREGSFCSYLDLDTISPQSIKGPIESAEAGSFWSSSISKFDAKLYGLNVVATAEYRAEGIGVRALIFDNTNLEVLRRLGQVYSGGFPTAVSGEGQVYCPECQYSADHPEFIAIQSEKATRGVYGLGKSAVECGVLD